MTKEARSLVGRAVLYSFGFITEAGRVDLAATVAHVCGLALSSEARGPQPRVPRLSWVTAIC